MTPSKFTVWRWVLAMGLAEIVFLVFLVLKLTGISAVADWSWWWVTAPLWGVYAAAFFFCILAVITGVIYALCTGKPMKSRSLSHRSAVFNERRR